MKLQTNLIYIHTYIRSSWSNINVMCVSIYIIYVYYVVIYNSI